MEPRKRGRRNPDRLARLLNPYEAKLRDRDSHGYVEKAIPPEFSEYATHELIPQLALTGYKIAEQQRVALHCFHNAVLAGLVGATVADTRNTHEPGMRLRVRTWDALVEAGFVAKELGSELSGKDTRYLATPRLHATFRDWPPDHLMNLKLGRNTMTPDKATVEALVVLRERKKDGGKVLPFPQDELDACLGGVSVGAYLEGVEDKIEFINRVNLGHSWRAYKELEDGRLSAFPPNFCLKQQHTKHLLEYARLYTWGVSSAQSLTKRERSMMEIDREPVAEFDYGQHNIRLLYHVLEIDPPREIDLYRPEQVLPGACRDVGTQPMAREFVKRATNICLNTATRNEAVMGVQGLLFKEKESPMWAAMLRGEGIKAVDVVERLIEAHPDVAHLFFTKVGAGLQTIDGLVMLHILMTFAKRDRPALGIHDSIVCRVSDAGIAEAWMTIEYLDLVGFEPVVRRVY